MAWRRSAPATSRPTSRTARCPRCCPFLADEFDLSYVLVGLAMLAWAFSSSILQPLFGLWSDRRGAIWLLPAGLALGGLGIALAAVAPSYWLCLVLITRLGPRHGRLPPRGDRSSRRTSAVAGGRAGCRCSRSAATSATRSGRSPPRSSSCTFGLRGRPAARAAVPGGRRGLLSRRSPYLRRFEPSREPARARAGEDRSARWSRSSGVIAFRSVCVVRADHVRAAVRGLAGQLGGVRQPAARGDAARRRDRHARRRAARRPRSGAGRCSSRASSRPGR